MSFCGVNAHRAIAHNSLYGAASLDIARPAAPAGFISIVLLSTPVISAAIAWFLFGEVLGPSPQTTDWAKNSGHTPFVARVRHQSSARSLPPSEALGYAQSMLLVHDRIRLRTEGRASIGLTQHILRLPFGDTGGINAPLSHELADAGQHLKPQISK